MRSKRRGVLAARLARLIELARAGRTMPTREALARDLGVVPRTITRDFAALRDAGFALVTQDGHSD